MKRIPTHSYVTQRSTPVNVDRCRLAAVPARSLPRSCTHTREQHNLKHAIREAAFRKVIARAGRRYKRLKLRALQRWRLAAAAAAMRALRQRQRRESLERGASLAEALLRRRVRARLSAGFQCWRDADAEVTASCLKLANSLLRLVCRGVKYLSLSETC